VNTLTQCLNRSIFVLLIVSLLAFQAKAGGCFGKLPTSPAPAAQEEQEIRQQDNNRDQGRIKVEQRRLDRSILDAVNARVGSKGIFDLYMIRDVAGIVDQYTDPEVRQASHKVYNYLHDVQGFTIRDGELVGPNGSDILGLLMEDSDEERVLSIVDLLFTIMKEYNIDSACYYSSYRDLLRMKVIFGQLSAAQIYDINGVAAYQD